MERTPARIVAGTFAAMTFAGGAFLLGYTHTAPGRAPAAEVAVETAAIEHTAPTAASAAPTAAPAVPATASDRAPRVAHERVEHEGGEDD